MNRVRCYRLLTPFQDGTNKKLLNDLFTLLLLTYSRTLGCGPRGPIANYTHVIVSLLEAWKLTVVWIEWMLPFLTPFQEGTNSKLFNSGKIIVDILKYLY